MIEKPIWVNTYDHQFFAQRLPIMLENMIRNDMNLTANQELARRIDERADHERWSRDDRQKLAARIRALPRPYWISEGRRRVPEIIEQMKPWCGRRLMIFDLTDAVRSLSCPEDCTDRRDNNQLLLLVSSREVVAAAVSSENYRTIHDWYDIELGGWR